MKDKYIFEYKSSLEHYNADAFIVRCVDDRFRGLIQAFVKELGFEHIDPKSPAGGAKIFSSPTNGSDREFMVRELEISIKLHHVKKVMLFTHHDCGAYGGFGKFDNDADAELEFHCSEHKKAAEFIHKHFPQLIVETFFMDEKGIIKTS